MEKIGHTALVMLRTGEISIQLLSYTRSQKKREAVSGSFCSDSFLSFSVLFATEQAGVLAIARLVKVLLLGSNFKESDLS